MFAGAFEGSLVLASPGAARLEVAIAPRTLGAVHHGHVIVESTAPASAVLRAYRRGRRVLRLDVRLRAGQTRLRLPRRLGIGVYTLRISARTPDGRADRHSLRVLGRARLTLAMARSIILDGFINNFVGEGTAESRTSRCRHRGPREVRCLMTGDFGAGARFAHLASARIRRDGVVIYSGHELPRGYHWAYVTTF
jgi:hypothetical protein